MVEPQKVREIEIELLQPNPLQPRGVITPESLVDLVDSIREHGILEPLVVAETPAGFQIVAGERRWRAAKTAGLKTVPIILKKTTPRGMLEMALVENVQRTDLNPIERAKAFQRLVSEFGLSTKTIAQRIGKSWAYISNSLRLLRLPDLLKDGLLSGQTSEGHVRALAALEEPKLIVEAYKKVLKESLAVRGTEEMVRRIKAREGILEKHITGKRKLEIRRPSAKLEKIETDLTQKFQALGCAPKITALQSRIQARLRIILDADMETTDKALQFVYERIMGKPLEV